MIAVNAAVNTEVNCLLKAVIGDPNGDYLEGVFVVVCLSSCGGANPDPIMPEKHATTELLPRLLGV